MLLKLSIMDFAQDFLDQYSSANPMDQEPFLHLADHKLTTIVNAQATRCSPIGEQRLQRPDDVKSSQRTPA